MVVDLIIEFVYVGEMLHRAYALGGLLGLLQIVERHGVGTCRHVDACHGEAGRQGVPLVLAAIKELIGSLILVDSVRELPALLA